MAPLRWHAPEALFLEVEDASGTLLTPEIFPRAGGTTYVCAISSETRLPVDPPEVEPDAGAIDRLIGVCRLHLRPRAC